jgi:hypothetical protein
MGTTKLEQLLDEEGGFLSHKELKILHQKDTHHARKSSIEGSDSLQEPRRKERGRTKGPRKAVYQSKEY